MSDQGVVRGMCVVRECGSGSGQSVSRLSGV